jgi:hypothetical protein
VLAYNMKRVMKILGVPGLLRVMQAWRLICHFLLGLACTVRSNGPDRFLPRDSDLHREMHAYASTSLRSGLANQSDTDFSHSLGLFRRFSKALRGHNTVSTCFDRRGSENETALAVGRCFAGGIPSEPLSQAEGSD